MLRISWICDLEMPVTECKFHGIQLRARLFDHLCEPVIEVLPHIIPHRVANDGNDV